MSPVLVMIEKDERFSEIGDPDINTVNYTIANYVFY